MPQTKIVIHLPDDYAREVKRQTRDDHRTPDEWCRDKLMTIIAELIPHSILYRYA